MADTYEDAWRTRLALQAEVARATSAHDAAVAHRDQAAPDSPDWARRDGVVTERRQELMDAAAAVVKHQAQVMQENELHGKALAADLPPADMEKIENSRGAMAADAYQAFDLGQDLGQLAGGKAAALPVIDPGTGQVLGQVIANIVESREAMYHYAAGTVRQAVAQFSEPEQGAPAREPPPVVAFDPELARLQAEVVASRQDLAVAQEQEKAFLQLPAETQAQGRGHASPEQVRAELDEKIAARDGYAAEHKPNIAEAFERADQHAQEQADQVRAAVEKTLASRQLGDEHRATLEQARDAELARVEAERNAAREAAITRELQAREVERQRQMQLDADRQR